MELGNGPFEVVHETGSVCCRFALWDCLGEEFDPVSHTNKRK